MGNTYAPDKEVKVHTNKEGKVVLVNGDTDAKKVQPTNKVAISKESATDKAFEAIKIDRQKAKNLKVMSSKPIKLRLMEKKINMFIT